MVKEIFFPHEHNEYKPHFLRHESTLLVALFIIVAELAFLAQIFVVFDKTNFLASVLPGILTSLTNEERAENDAAPLVQNDLLTRAAEMKAMDMATNGYFAHTSPDGKTPWYWLSQVGYKYTMAGENLAVNFFESEDVARAWMNSPTHRENIVKKGYTEIGIGVANGVYQGKDTVFIAQFFGTPLPTYTPIVSNIPVNEPTTSYVAEETKNSPPVQNVEPKIVETPPEEISNPPVAIAPTQTQILGQEIQETQETKMPTKNNISFISKVLTSPHHYLSYIYGGIVLLILLVIFLLLLIRSEKAHRGTLARGGVLIAIILALLVVNVQMLRLKTQLPAEDVSASVVAN